MPLSVAAKLSTDAGNNVVAGTDGGLFMPTAARGPNSQYIIDNSWTPAGSGTTYWYTQSYGTSQNVGFTNGVARLYPFAVAKNAKIDVNSPIRVTVNVASSKVFATLYNADATTGLPSTKFSDLFQYSTGLAGIQTPTLAVGTSPTLTAGTLYWLAWWYTGSSQPQVWGLSAPGTNAVRSSTMGTTASMLLQGVAPSCYIESTAPWASMSIGASTATVNPDLNTVSLTYSFSGQPLVYWGLINV